ncbi:MAG: ligase-associated DNA damage response DEXH box helicase [Balneolales bacterium]
MKNYNSRLIERENTLPDNTAYQTMLDWFSSRGWKPFSYQEQMWQAYLDGFSGILNAPTGTGKTLAVVIPPLMKWMHDHADYRKRKPNGLKILWITPLRALARDTEKVISTLLDELGIPWEVLRRTGDASASVKQRIGKRPPEVLITTPESLHLMLARKGHEMTFNTLKAVIVDEWHELLGSKRGVQVELALSRIRQIRSDLKTWGLSATIGNFETALEVLVGSAEKQMIIPSGMEKKIEVNSVIPDEIEKFPWAGHLGIHLLEKVYPVIKKSGTTLLFTNTRSQTEIWYNRILETYPELAGRMAIHHGSISSDIRGWVEDALHAGSLQLVICTSSLDLGVDFSPVDTVIQVGSPKGVDRFLQRAGRSGHQPGAVSRIWFVPTHALELLEAAALKTAMAEGFIESREPVINPLDVLVQYLLTLATGDGFDQKRIYHEIRSTYAFKGLTEGEWEWVLKFLLTGGNALKRYEDYSRVYEENGLYQISGRRIAKRHRMSIGTIVGDPSLQVKYITGGYLGSIEESFISKMRKGDVFLFAGRYLEFIRIKDLTVYVRKTKKKKGATSRWMGGRMALSSRLSEMIRTTIRKAKDGIEDSIEVKTIQPILDLQEKLSALPRENELLIEKIQSKEGFHLFFYPFEGRLVHEGLASLFAWRISRIQPISFSLAMNDYGFELLSDREAPLEEAICNRLFSADQLSGDIHSSINSTEMARRHFREIARISGLVFQGYPGNSVSGKHLQASSQMIFEVFQKHDPGNLLVKQTFREIMNFQLKETHLRRALERINHGKLLVKEPGKATPFAFPIMVDRLRDELTSEKLYDRIRRMQRQLQK